MTAVEAPTTSTSKRRRRAADDPELYRMSIGDHLEELRWRLILALLGFMVVFIGCLFFGNDVIRVFCKPLTDTLEKKGINPQLYITDPSEAFMTYIHISLI